MTIKKKPKVGVINRQSPLQLILTAITKLKVQQIVAYGSLITIIGGYVFHQESNHSESLQAIKQVQDTAKVQVKKIDSASLKNRQIFMKNIRHLTIIDSNLDLDIDTILTLLKKK